MWDKGTPPTTPGQSKYRSRPCPFLPPEPPFFLPSLQCPSFQTVLPVSAACLATSGLPHFFFWPWLYVTPQTRTNLSPFSQVSWRAEGRGHDPHHLSAEKGLLSHKQELILQKGLQLDPRGRGVQCGLGVPRIPWEEQALTFSCRGIKGRGSQPTLRARLFPRILRGWDEKFPLIQRF